MKFSIPNHLRRHKLTATLLASVLFAGPAMAGLEDAKAILEVLLKKGVISQKDYDKTLEEWNSKPLESAPPVEFVQDALGVKAKDVQKAVEYTQKDEKNGSVKPSGFGWVSADGQNSVNLTGTVQFDTRSISNGITSSSDKDTGSGGDNFEVRRARIGLNGTFFNNIDYEILTNLVGSSPNLIHRAYVNYNFNPVAQVRVGRFKQPFSLEEQTSANAIDFLERSYGNQLVASQRLGAMVFGEPTKGFTYAISAYQDGFNEITNTNGNGNLGIGRLTLNLAEFTGAKDSVIHFGAGLDAGSYKVTPTTSTDTGNAASLDTRATILAFRTESRGLANAYRAQIAGDKLAASSEGYGVAGDNAANVTKNLKGIELALAHQGFKFQSEYFNSSYSASTTYNNGTSINAGSTSLQLSAIAKYHEFIYNLTGESWANSYKSGAFTSIKPKSNFSTGPNGGWGAWQLAYRYSNYSVTEPSGVSNVATSTVKYVNTRVISTASGTSITSRGENSESANTQTIGLNWILNPNARVIFNYSLTKFDRPVTYLSSSTSTAYLSKSSREDVLSIRSQFNF